LLLPTFGSILFLLLVLPPLLTLIMISVPFNLRLDLRLGILLLTLLVLRHLEHLRDIFNLLLLVHL
jgi:hypothetical protein